MVTKINMTHATRTERMAFYIGVAEGFVVRGEALPIGFNDSDWIDEGWQMALKNALSRQRRAIAEIIEAKEDARWEVVKELTRDLGAGMALAKLQGEKKT